MPLKLTFALAFCNITVSSAIRLVLSLYALKLGAQPFAVGVLGTLLWIFPLLLSWPVGRAADRIGVRWLLLFGAACGAASLLAAYFASGMPALYAASVLSGLSMVFTNVILQLTVGKLSTEEDRTRNYSNYSLVISTSSFLGPLAAGYAIDYSGHAMACLYLLPLNLLSISLLAVRGHRLPGGSRTAAQGGRPWEALADRDLWRMLFVSSMAQLGTDMFQFYLPIYGHGVGLSASTLGVALAGCGIAAFLVRMVMARAIARMGEEKLLARCFYLSAVCFLALPLFESATAVVLVAFVFGLTTGCTHPLTIMLMFARSPQGRAGEMLGIRLTAGNLMRALGPVVFGAVAAAFGLAPIFVANALLAAGAGHLTRPAAEAPARPA